MKEVYLCIIYFPQVKVNNENIKHVVAVYDNYNDADYWLRTKIKTEANRLRDDTKLTPSYMIKSININKEYNIGII